MPRHLLKLVILSTLGMGLLACEDDALTPEVANTLATGTNAPAATESTEAGGPTAVNSTTTAATGSAPRDPSSVAYKLASIDANSKNPSSSQTQAMTTVVRSLLAKCPKDTDTRLGDYLVSAQSLLTSRGKAMSLLQLGRAVDGAIPASGYSGSCADVVAALVTSIAPR